MLWLTKTLTKFPPRRKYWAEYSYRSAQILIRVAFLFGALPLKFKIESKNKMQFVDSNFHYLRWKVTVGSAMALFAAIGTRFCYDVFVGKIKLNDVHDAVNIFVITGCLLATVFHGHTLWRIEDIVGFINLCVAYYEGFQSNCTLRIKYEHFIFLS